MDPVLLNSIDQQSVGSLLQDAAPFLHLIVTTTATRNNLLAECTDSILLSLSAIDSLLFRITFVVDIKQESDLPGFYKAISQLHGLKGKCEVIRLPLNGFDGLAGVAMARNVGILSSNCEWILFLDDDDLLVRKGFLSLLSAALTANKNISLIAGGYEFNYHNPSTHETRPSHTVVPTLEQMDRLIDMNPVAIGAYLIRRAAISSLFNSSIRTLEDWLFLIQNSINSSSAKCIDSICLKVRSVEGSRGKENGGLGYKRDREYIDFLHNYQLFLSAMK
jgi:hypothetical protein